MKHTLSPAYDTYRIFRCSDCDPDYYDEDTPDDERYDGPYEIILPIDGQLVTGAVDESSPIGDCPRCGSHLSMCTDTEVTVTRTFTPDRPTVAEEHQAKRDE